MKGTVKLQFLLLFIAGLIPLGCSTTQTHAVEKPSVQGHLVKADPSLERFLVAHGFHREEQDIYSRQYRTLSEAGEDLGISLVNLPIPPNAPAAGLDEQDQHVFELHHWGFTVLSEKGRRLDDPNTPCTVSVSLVQVQ